MQLSVERNLLENFAAVGFERGAEVVNIDAAELGHQPVRDARRNAPHPEIVDADFAPAADDVIACGNLFQKDRDVGGIVLQIAIHGDDIFTARVIEASRQSCSLAEVTAQLDHGDATIDSCNFAEHRESVVTGAVVHQHNFESLAGSLHHHL